MKKMTFVIMSIVICLFASPALAKSQIPKGAQEFADTMFIDIVQNHLQTSKNITFGPLYKVYTLTYEFVNDKNSVASEGIIPSGEYIAAVYLDGMPVNVIGTYKNKSGKYEMSTFGYGIELATELDKLSGDEKLLNEAPRHNWYIYRENKIQPLPGTAKNTMGEEIELNDFKDIIYEIYEERRNEAGNLPFVDRGLLIAALLLAIIFLLAWFYEIRKNEHQSN